MIILTILFLAFMEVTLSFDNAIINASVLTEMSAQWRRRFIVWGMPVAVFGMRFAFPILIVCVSAHLGVREVIELALNNPKEYSARLHEAHPTIAAFGGMFLLMVFLKFVFEEKEIYWLKPLETRLARVGKLESMVMVLAILLLVGLQMFHKQETFIVYGLIGICLHELIGMMGDSDKKRTGLSAFIYLEILDASCSFDGVIGAFVLTDNIILIMAGLGIGALAVRSLTLYLVKGGTLKEYIYLEHGAHYAIGALGAIMLASIFYPVPEPVTGMIGVTVIGLSLLSSVNHNRRKVCL